MSARILIIACTAAAVTVPVTIQAQGRDQYFEGLVDFSNAVAGIYGDEGPALVMAIDAMEAGLQQWDRLVAKVESGFAAEIQSAPPAAAARMRAALGTVYLERGRPADALAQFDAAVELDPQFADVHVLRGLVHELLDQPEPLSAAHRSLWRANPGNPAHAYLFVRSGGTEQVTDSAAAMKTLLAAVEQLGPSSGGPLFATLGGLDEESISAPLFLPAAYADAVALVSAGQYDAAVAHLRVVVASDPLVHDRTVQDARVREAVASLRRGDAAAAVGTLAGLASGTQSGELYRILGAAYRDAGQYDRSLEPLRRAAQSNPNDERARLVLADVLVAVGDPAAARDVLLETVQAMPKSGQSYWRLGRLQQLMGDEIGALRAFEAAAGLPALAGARHAHAAVGRLYHNQLDLDAAEAAYQRRVELSPNDAAAHYDLGEIYRAQGRLERAMAEYLVAALLDPTDARVFATIGQMHAADGRDDAAVVVLTRAIDLDAAHIEARYALSRALMRLGKTDEARRHLEIFQKLQATAMDDERQRFRDNQRRIEEALKAGEPGGAGR
jgi:tetratricopeptide (TPR) repeat protein